VSHTVINREPDHIALDADSAIHTVIIEKRTRAQE
jgi:hypothetical protein